MYDTETELANIMEWFFTIIFGDISSLGTKMKAWLLMNPCADYYFIDGYTRIENPFYNFWSSAGVSIQSILSGVATTMCGIFFVVEFAKTLSRVEGTTYEAVVGLGCKFCFARLAISLGDKLMTALTLTGAQIISNVSAVSSLDGFTPLQMAAFYGNIWGAVKDAGVTGFFALIVIIIIPCLVVKAVTIIAMVMAYGRLLELMFYHAFMPLPMGCLFIDNARITKRFFASYFATILQGVFMFVGYSIFTSNINPLIQDIIDTPLGSGAVEDLAKMLFKVTMWGIMMVIIMMKSGSWASKMVGEG